MKTWLITGCSTGIGRGIAATVLAHGDRAVVTARNTDSVANFAADYPDTCRVVSLDVTDADARKKAVSTVMEAFGQIDVLVNNAGHGYRSSVEEGDDAQVRELFETNFFGAVGMIKEVLPHMRAKRSGTIINITSIAASKSAVGSGYYAASKAALELLSEGLIQEVKPLGIDVLIVEPGAFRTEFYGDHSMQGAALTIEDYKDTAWTRAKHIRVDTSGMPGNPEKAGDAIIAVLAQEKLPLRYYMGSDANRIITATLEERVEEIKAQKALSALSDG